MATFTQVQKLTWQTVPDLIIYKIFSNLKSEDLNNCKGVCLSWSYVAHDDRLWKRLLMNIFPINKSISISPGKNSWCEEYNRLTNEVPSICAQTLTEHSDEVLHISFSNNGEMFATTSKDCTIKLWRTNYPTHVLFSEDLSHTLESTRFSQFNPSDTLLLVSGPSKLEPFNPNDGKICLFIVNKGKLEVLLHSKIGPFDLFSPWYNDTTFFSGRIESTRNQIENFIISYVSLMEPNKVYPHYEFKFANPVGLNHFINYLQIADTAEYTDKHNKSDNPDKLLIFARGYNCTVSHQVCFKRISGNLDQLKESYIELLDNEFDDVDSIIDFKGCIIGMALSPDNRLWPPDFDPTTRIIPPVTQEVELIKIDLKTNEISEPLRQHKAFTDTVGFFYLFLSVSHDYVASGSEDKRGYLWDRHYNVCVQKYPHDNVVNCAAICPTNQQLLITASDDYTIKVWHSKNSQKLLENLLFL